jgi:signal transduction histidine kinase
MIHKVIQLTLWPNETSFNHIQIGVYGGTTTYTTKLNENYLGREIRNKKINVSTFDPFSSNKSIQVLIIKNEKNEDLKKISNQLKNRNILLISENSSDRHYLMVNLFTSPEGNLGFEINRSNIILAKLKISKDIVLAGGTELDVAEILDQAVSDLSRTKENLSAKIAEVTQQSLLLKQQQFKISELDEAIIKQQDKLHHQDLSILSKNTELKLKEDNLKNLEKKLATKIKIINSSTAALEQIESNLEISSQSLANQEVKNLTLADKIKSNLQVLDQQKEQLNLKEALLNQKSVQLNQADETVSQQESTIQTQKNLLIISISIGILFISLIAALYRLFIAKKKSSLLLENKNQQLEKAMNNLHLTQEQLIESEKMASLGGMVAGIAHEVNTPTGIVLTADTSLLENTKLLQKQVADGSLTKKILNKYLDYSVECNTISVQNIKRVASLIKTFKQVSVDHTNNEYCQFNLSTRLDEVLVSLQYLIHETRHKIHINIADYVVINSYPAVYVQIINSLISNSLTHGFDQISEGSMELDFKVEGDNLLFSYKDNGVGATDEVIYKIFDPFYTTRRGSGSSGLGTHILYNMVTQLLKGKVSCKRNSPQGLIFEFELPLNIFASRNFEGTHPEQA